MEFGGFRVTLGGWGAALRIPDCPKLPGNERIRSRAFFYVSKLSKRIILGEVTVLQR